MDDELDGVPSHLLGYNVTGRTRILFYWIIPTCLQLIAYLIQMSADIGVTYQHFNTNNPLFGGITLIFICLPAIISFILIILTPKQYPNIIGRCCNIENWKFLFNQFCSFIIFPIWAIYRFSRRIFWSIESLFYDKDMFERYHCVSIAAESSPFELYHFVQAYAQSAPQIILQLFILLTENIFRNYETSNIQIVSVIFSLINLSMITVTFQRFESQRIVGGRYLPWATFNQIQKTKEELKYATEKIILSTAGKRQSSISLTNNKRHLQQYRHRNLHFPENDKIFHKFQLSVTSDTDTSPTLDESKPSQVKNHGKITTNTQMNSSFTPNDEIDFNNLKRVSSGQTGIVVKEENFQNYNNENTMTKNNNNNNNNNSNEEESRLFLNNNNEKIILAHTNCIDPIPIIVEETGTIDNTDICLNITDDDKFLKNCQNINNNMNNNENSNHDDYTDDTKTIVADIVVETAVAAPSVKPIEKITSKENVQIIENLDRLQIVGTISEYNSLMLNNPSQVKNSNCKNRNRITEDEQQQHNINEIVFIGEEMLNINPKDNQKYNRNSISNINLEKMNFDKVPDIPAPPPPTTSPQILPFQFLLGTSPKNSSDNVNYRSNEEQLNNLNPLNRLSTFKDMIIIKTENYIVENLPHPPRYLIDKKNDRNQSKKFIKSEYINNNINNINNNNNNIISDTVDFFLPKGRKTINGIEQDDFIGKFVAFFGWLMFIYMRMLSLSVFSVYYLYNFYYILIIHYFIMLIILSIDFKEFKNNIKNLPIYIFLSYVYIFVIIEFQIKFRRIRLWYGCYMVIILLENYIITIIWYENCEFESWWFEYIFITIIGSGLLFIACMIVYYYILRPNDVMLLEK